MFLQKPLSLPAVAAIPLGPEELMPSGGRPLIEELSTISAISAKSIAGATP